MIHIYCRAMKSPLPLSEIDHSPILVVAGPTASGKSALALDMGEAFDGTVINADSMQVYRELRVLTARPNAADEARVPHRLFGVLAAGEIFSAGRWLSMARHEIQEARSIKRLPIVVGGTGLYLKALMEGLAPIPDIPADIRFEARAMHAQLGGAAFREELAALDEESAQHLPAGDRQRLVRAYEVARATGRPIGEWQKGTQTIPAVAGPFIKIVIQPARDDLYAAIESRFDAMMESGALDEVGALLELQLDDDVPVMKAVGVRQLAAVLRGKEDLDGAVSAAKKASRNYAKRQMTWIRHQLTGDFVVNEQYSERFRGKILSNIRHFMLTPEA